MGFFELILTPAGTPKQDDPYSERVIEAEAVTCVIHLYDAEIIVPTVIQDICTQLQIDPKGTRTGVGLTGNLDENLIRRYIGQNKGRDLRFAGTKKQQKKSGYQLT